MDRTVENMEDEESDSASSIDSDNESIIVDFQSAMTEGSNHDDNSLLIDT